MACSVLSAVPPIDDHMNPHFASLLTSIYRLLLNAYPPSYHDQFEDEMFETFLEGVAEAESLGTLASFLLREFREMPNALIKAYWDGWKTRLQNGIQTLQDVASTSDLPPAPPDGRESWQQALLELSPFVVTAFLLIFVTYLPFSGVNAGWQRDPDFLGKVITPLTLPFLLLGLARGFPRWAYPLGGLLFGYFGLTAGQTGLWLFLTIMLLASFMLVLAAILTDPHPSQLPIPIRRIGQSLSIDWTRLSFGVYGAMPLIILMAFDDAHTNSRTPYFVFAILVMLVCALIYCRSRDTTIRIATLLAGLSFSIWCAWLDNVSFAGGLMNWVTVTSSGLESILWMGVLWLQWAVCILLPVVFFLINRALHLKRAV